MKRSAKKLNLHRETLRVLTEASLQKAHGGLSRYPICPETLDSGCYCPSISDCSACPTCPF